MRAVPALSRPEQHRRRHRAGAPYGIGPPLACRGGSPPAPLAPDHPGAGQEGGRGDQPGLAGKPRRAGARHGRSRAVHDRQPGLRRPELHRFGLRDGRAGARDGRRPRHRHRGGWRRDARDGAGGGQGGARTPSWRGPPPSRAAARPTARTSPRSAGRRSGLRGSGCRIPSRSGTPAPRPAALHCRRDRDGALAVERHRNRPPAVWRGGSDALSVQIGPSRANPASVEQVKIGTAGYRPFHRLRAGDPAFGLPVRPRLRRRSGDSPSSFREPTREGSQGAGPRPLDPAIEGQHAAAHSPTTRRRPVNPLARSRRHNSAPVRQPAFHWLSSRGG